MLARAFITIAPASASGLTILCISRVSILSS
jgi:hypothetical protein